MAHKIEPCSDCGKTKPVVRREQGSPLCGPCWKRRRAEPCATCGKLKPVNHRNEDGTALCTTCDRKRRAEQCAVCGKLRPVSTRLSGQPLCGKCRLSRLPQASFSDHVRRAGLRNLAWDLSYDEFVELWGKPCFHCGEAINGIGLDRLDNSKGYAKDNVVPCCSPCNYMRGTQSIEDFHYKAGLIAAQHPTN